MSTKREQIMAKLATVISGVTGITGGVYRSRVLAFTRGQSPAVAVEPASDVPDESVMGVLDWALVVRVAIVVRGEVADQIADPIAEGIHEAIMADRTLGGLSFDLSPQTVNFEIYDGDNGIGVTNLGFLIRYRTSPTDLSA